MAKATREAYGEALAKLIQENEKIVVLDADLSGSTKTIEAKKVCPQRFFNLGIAEADMIGHAAGLAASGYTAFCSSFAMFASGRAWEQIRNSVAYPHLNVKICATHAGITVGEDGVSHQAIEDIALMRVIPGMQVFVPCDETQTKAVIAHVAAVKGPCYVRLGRSKAADVYAPDTAFDFTKIQIVRKGRNAVLFACGIQVQAALEAAEKLAAEGIELQVVDVCAIKPCDVAGIQAVLEKFEHVFTAEEHSVIGGLGGLIAETASQVCPRRIVRIGMQDCYAESGAADALLKKYGLDGEGVYQVIRQSL